MFKKQKPVSEFFVKDNTLGDVYLYLRTGEFDGGPRLHYLLSLVDKKIKAIPDDLYQLTYTREDRLKLADIGDIDKHAYYFSTKTRRLFQAFNRLMTNNYPVEWSVVGTYVSLNREPITIPEYIFLSEFKEVVFDG